MSIKLIAILLVIALLWWIYDFCGGDLTCRPMDYVIRSPLRWIFSAEEFLARATRPSRGTHMRDLPTRPISHQVAFEDAFHPTRTP